MKKSDKIRYIDPVTDKDLVDSIVHNRPRQDLLNNWKELRQILSRITRATGTSPHISQVPFWGDRFVIGPQDNFVAATSRLDSSLYNLYGMAIALLAASSDNITYADAVVESKLRISRKILVASTTHLVDNQAFSRCGMIGYKRIVPYYLSTWNYDKVSFRLGAPIFCYMTKHDGGNINLFETRLDLDSWFWHDQYSNHPDWEDFAIFPVYQQGKGWFWVTWVANNIGKAHGCAATGFGYSCFTDLRNWDGKGYDGIPHSFSFSTPDLWAQSSYGFNMFHRYALRYSDRYYRVMNYWIDSSGDIHRQSERPSAWYGDLPFNFPNEFYRGVQYYLQLNAELVLQGVLALCFIHWMGTFAVNIHCSHWVWTGSDWVWTRPIVGWLRIPPGELTPETDMIVTISITTIPGEPDTYLVLLSAFHDNWSRNYWKKIKINNYWDRSYNAEWDGSFFEPIYDEKGNLFDHKLSVASNVPMIDGKKLVVDFGAGPGEDIKGIWVRELEFRTI